MNARADNLAFVSITQKGEFMLNKEELNYLAMLVIKDQREVFKSYKENEQLEEAEKQKDVREEIIKKLNKMYDDLC